MNDDNKESYGLTPMRLEIDTSEYVTGCFVESDGKVSAMVKWEPVTYENVYKYYVYIWRNPSWYDGDHLYHMELGTEPMTSMINTSATVYTLPPSYTSYTVGGLEQDEEYYMAVFAQADTETGYLSDVYITRYTTTLTPEDDDTTPEDDDTTPEDDDTTPEDDDTTPEPSMNDDNKASYGLTPMRIQLDTSEYSNGCFTEAGGNISAMVKWTASPYENIYKYYIYVWRNPEWYTGDILYHLELGTEPMISMSGNRSLKRIYELPNNYTNYTIGDLTSGTEYYIAVIAQADNATGILSDIYVTKFVAEDTGSLGTGTTDENKEVLGLKPMSIALDTSVYGDGRYADSENTVAAMLKWNKNPYPHIYKYYVYVWENPSWYVGNILYRLKLGTELTNRIADTAKEFFEFSSDTTQCTVGGLNEGVEYCVAVIAQADHGTGFLSDIYVTKFVAEWDHATPKIYHVQPHYRTDNDFYIATAWSRFAGYNGDHYALYVWTGRQDWYVGEGWYDVIGDEQLAQKMALSAASVQDVDLNTFLLPVEKIDDSPMYYLGVVVYHADDDPSPGIVSNMYVVECPIATVWKWIPRGEFSQTSDWGTNIIDFETGVRQYQQKYTQPIQTFTATFEGTIDMWYEMQSFIDAHKGNLYPFFLWMDDKGQAKKYKVRLAESKYNPKFQTEVFRKRTANGLAGRKIVGFTVALSFVEVKD